MILHKDNSPMIALLPPNSNKNLPKERNEFN